MRSLCSLEILTQMIHPVVIGFGAVICTVYITVLTLESKKKIDENDRDDKWETDRKGRVFINI